MPLRHPDGAFHDRDALVGPTDIAQCTAPDEHRLGDDVRQVQALRQGQDAIGDLERPRRVVAEPVGTGQ